MYSVIPMSRSHKSRIVAFLLFFPLLALLGVTAVAQIESQKSHLDWAFALVRGVKPENTSYQHKQGFVKWKGDNGAEDYESRTDCSGFLNSLLKQAYGFTPDDFEKWLGKRRPLAIEYFEAIQQQKDFRQILAARDLRPGDVIAIRYPPGTNENTGHMMLIADVAHRRKPSKPEIPDEDQWEVSIVDSSESGHGKTDTRRNPDGTFGSGVGQGILRLYTNSAGEIVGYTWSTFAVSDYYDQSSRQLVVGRLKLRRNFN